MQSPRKIRVNRLASMLVLVAAFGCSSKPSYQPLPIASADTTGDPEGPTQAVDGTLCDRFAACAPHLFGAEYPGGRQDCIVNVYGSGRGVHVSASTADACSADLSASCDFAGDADAGADAGHFPTLVLPASCRSL